jgi:hypothetical protein
MILEDRGEVIDTRRRRLLTLGGFLLGLALPAADAHAGEVGAKITKAVTTSELGIEVRRSVVRGAQVIDQLDGSWERFSDKYNLGAERSKRGDLPKPRIIPERQALNQKVATQFLVKADEAFLSLMPPSSGIDKQRLEAKITAVEALLQKSFERSGLNLADEADSQLMTAEGFNYRCYTHFRSYNDILLSEKSSIKFNQFRPQFEQRLGDHLLALLIPDEPSAASNKGTNTLQSALDQALVTINKVLTALQQNGLIASCEQSDLSDDKVQDWADDLSELQYTVGVDGDVTLQSQILLQEQGYRLYPNFARFIVASLLGPLFRPLQQSVSSDEYYMDTDYNSDPDKFEVKQVLLNIVIDSET